MTRQRHQAAEIRQKTNRKQGNGDLNLQRRFSTNRQQKSLNRQRIKIGEKKMQSEITEMTDNINQSTDTHRQHAQRHDSRQTENSKGDNREEKRKHKIDNRQREHIKQEITRVTRQQTTESNIRSQRDARFGRQQTRDMQRIETRDNNREKGIAIETRKRIENRIETRGIIEHITSNKIKVIDNRKPKRVQTTKDTNLRITENRKETVEKKKTENNQINK